MKRRQFIGNLSAGIAGMGLAACGGSNAGTTAKPTFILVPGAWLGSWCWTEVVRLLAQQGYPAIAVDLPGHGMKAKFPVSYFTQDPAALASEPSPLAALTLNDYRDHVVALIRGLTAGGTGPVVLVGHSLNGATISAVGEAIPDLVRRLVYLSAFVPVKYDTVLAYLQQPDFATSGVPALFVADPTKVGALRINFNSSDPAYNAKAKNTAFADVDDATLLASARLSTPDEPLQAFTTKVTATAAKWGSVPRAYIRCTQDNALPLAVQDKMIADADAFAPNNRFVQKSLNTSHSPFASNPQALVDALVALV